MGVEKEATSVSKLSDSPATAILGTEESGHCIEVAIMGKKGPV